MRWEDELEDFFKARGMRWEDCAEDRDAWRGLEQSFAQAVLAHAVGASSAAQPAISVDADEVLAQQARRQWIVVQCESIQNLRPHIGTISFE